MAVFDGCVWYFLRLLFLGLFFFLSSSWMHVRDFRAGLGSHACPLDCVGGRALAPRSCRENIPDARVTRTCIYPSELLWQVFKRLGWSHKRCVTYVRVHVCNLSMHQILDGQMVHIPYILVILPSALHSFELNLCDVFLCGANGAAQTSSHPPLPHFFPVNTCTTGSMHWKKTHPHPHPHPRTNSCTHMHPHKHVNCLFNFIES